MKAIESYLREDIGFGDITTNALIADEFGVAVIKAQENCVLAGLEEAVEVFRTLGLKASTSARDGEKIAKGKDVLKIEGQLKRILSGERVGLNFLMRMSGIATLTSQTLEACRRENPDVRIAATRKTTPGFRYYEKKAVSLGGGDPHRFRLDDAILIKENHIQVVGTASEAIRRAKKASFTKKIEIEVTNLQQAEEAARAGADIIMLDNMSPEKAAEAYRSIKSIDRKITVEASGGINAQNAPQFAKSADVLSLGCLTHSPGAVQFSLDLTSVSGH